VACDFSKVLLLFGSSLTSCNALAYYRLIGLEKYGPHVA
jgi:hypothetical protein